MNRSYEARYRDELDGLNFSKVEKERLVASLEACACNTSRQASDEATRDKGSQTTGPAGPIAAVQGRRHRALRLMSKVAAGIVLLSVVVMAPALALAHGSMGVALGYIADVFTGAPADTEVVERVGRPLGCSASSAGVTVTADAVLADHSNCTVILSLTKDDGTPFENLPKGSGDGREYLSLMFEGPSGIRIDGVSGAGGSGYFYDANPDDPSIQCVLQMNNTTKDGGAIAGRTARLHLRDLMSFADYEGAEVMVPGTWDLKFKMPDTDLSVEVPEARGREVNWVPDQHGSDDQKADETGTSETGTIQSLYVSPIGFTLTYETHAVEHNGLPQTPGRGEVAPNLRGIPLTVTYADGSSEVVGGAISVGPAHDGRSVVTQGGQFMRIASPGEVASVSLGDATFMVPSN